MGKPIFAGLQIHGAEQPAHLCSLISAIVKRLLQSIVSNRPKGKFQAELYWFESHFRRILKTGFLVIEPIH